MSYQALYRAWRPKRFEDIVGQTHITKTLQNAIVQNKLSHAYLFTGPRGTGKTSAAKIVAKAVNCEKAPVKEPCNTCENCAGIMDGSISDIIEIDAASNNGVDEIRDIRDKVKYAPSSVRYKVYIIDEVHMLTTGAFNALLKTLEEPPRHVIFILATTEPHKVPLTIISRCQRFDFRTISMQTMVQRMKNILEAESVLADEEALYMVARAADGGMRDALSILDQAISYSEERVTTDDVLAVTGTVSQPFLSRVASAFQQRNVEDALLAVEELIEEGKDPVRFLEDLLFYFRDLLLYQTAPKLEEALERVNVDQRFQALAQQVEKEWIYSVIHMLNESQQQMKWTNHPRIFLEVACIKICHLKEKASSLDEIIQRMNHLEKELSRIKDSKATTEQSARHKPAAPNRSYGSQALAASPIKAILQKASKRELTRLKQVWDEVMDEIRHEKVSAHAWLKESQPVACSNDAFLLSFPYELHSQMAGKEPIRSTVEAIVSKMFDRPMTMLTILEEEWKKVKEAFIRGQQEQSDSMGEQEDPLVEEAIKLVGKELIEIKEGGSDHETKHG